MPDLDELSLAQFQYELPDDRIARFPVTPRDASKLLVYRQGTIQHARFTDLPDLLPPESYLVFNNTKVIPARLHFNRPTGALIELFLLNPVADQVNGVAPIISQAMARTGSAVWQAMVGNRKRWKPTESLTTTFSTAQGEITLRADWADYEQSTIRLSWQPADLTFAELIQEAGKIPLPPYLKRDATEADRDTYQTIYSDQAGAVAAPTAGLHFTSAIFDQLASRGIGHDYLTLHVGAGTFQPIKSDDVRQHHMHTEEVVYSRENLRNILQHVDRLIPVGTTSMRALESLYWIGVRLIRNEPDTLRLDQHYAYRIPIDQQPAVPDAVQAVLHYIERSGQESVVVHTGIYITPGYSLKLCKGIVTNFHQPGSTLILLIATLLGNDWKRVYDEALQHDYRFLSYGDSSLLLS